MKRALLFFGTLLVCAGLAWLGGYNFDTRGGDVPYSAAMALLFAFVIALIFGDDK